MSLEVFKRRVELTFLEKLLHIIQLLNKSIHLVQWLMRTLSMNIPESYLIKKNLPPPPPSSLHAQKRKQKIFAQE